MKLISAISLCVLVMPLGAALAQDNTLPESMRIQQSVTQQNAADPNMPANRGSSETITEAPGGLAGPVEKNRLDPAAPSSQRLQIDDGRSAAVRQNPDVQTLHPGPSGTSYNTILRGSPSSSGASSGTSGFGSSRSGASSMGSGGSSGGASGGGH